MLLIIHFQDKTPVLASRDMPVHEGSSGGGFHIWEMTIMSSILSDFELGELVAIRPLKGTFTHMSYH